MLRIRRYRVFLIFAAFLIFLVYRFSHSGEQSAQIAVPKPVQKPNPNGPGAPAPPKIYDADHGKEDYKPELKDNGEAVEAGARIVLGTSMVADASSTGRRFPLYSPSSTIQKPVAAKTSSLVVEKEKAVSTSKPGIAKPTQTAEPKALIEEDEDETAAPPVPPTDIDEDEESIKTVPAVGIPDRKPYDPNAKTAFEAEQGTTLAEEATKVENAYDEKYRDSEGIAKAGASKAPQIHWQKVKENFPVASLIALPKGKPKKFPTIQTVFPLENEIQRAERQKRQAMVKKEFLKAWKGYKQFAWMHDELRPKSGGFRDPFCGWAATLVDTLDTLWIMGFKEEFEEAVEAVKNIDFTTSVREAIPVFETTIRYLGGLLGAYDVSNMEYPILLEKAKELGEILLGSFDTPNRMPKLFFQWQPHMASEPRRAAEMSNFAELGSLTMEFTRLAQLTGEDKYYDAVARITDALVEWQERGTKLPGVFPSDVDTTGCNKTIPEVRMPELPVQPAPAKAAQTVYSDAALNRLADIGEPVAGKAPAKRDLSEVATPATKAKAEAPPPSAAEVPVFANVGNTPGMMRNFGFDIDCPKQGLTGKTYGREHFSMGGGQDSTYEYFSKMYLLLGGLDDTYKKLYLDAMDAVREHMLFRPMIPEGKTRPILFSARLDVSDAGYGEVEIEKEYEVTHLTCFIGGMFGMGSRIFGIEQDLRIAEELTEGCVWAYDSTKTGIMPETARAIPCDGMTPCEWNETTWRRWLDPFADQRAINVAEWEEKKKKFEEEERIAEQQKALDRSLTDEDAEVEGADGDANVDEEEEEGETFTLGGHSKPAVALDARVAEHDEDADGSTLTKASSVKAGTSTQLQKRKPPVYEEEEVQIEEAEIDEDETDYDGNAAAEAELQQGAAVPPTGTKLAKAGSGEDEGVNTVVDAPVVATGKAKATAKAMPKLSNGGSKWSEYLMPQNSKLGTRPQTHQEYVDARIQRERIPKGFGGVSSERYILRPEAIESVWYMHRLTADPQWSEKGWKMFNSIIQHTSTKHGHSAINFVHSDAPHIMDSMESFWLAETLKYFYLLWDEPERWSLDDWVFNTEAHLFRRPRAGQ